MMHVETLCTRTRQHLVTHFTAQHILQQEFLCWKQTNWSSSQLVTGSSRVSRDTEQVDIKDTVKEGGRSGGHCTSRGENIIPRQTSQLGTQDPTTSCRLRSYYYSAVGSAIIIHDYLTDSELT
jgi:hypothetical protein